MKYFHLFSVSNLCVCVDRGKFLSSLATTCVTLGRLLKGAVPLFPHPLNGDNIRH